MRNAFDSAANGTKESAWVHRPSSSVPLGLSFGEFLRRPALRDEGRLGAHGRM